MAAEATSRLARAVVWALSLSRLGLAALFPFLSPWWRIAAVFTAAISDGVDGYLARRFGVASWWGAAVDAGTDKLFTLTVLVVLTLEHNVAWWQLALLLPRDAVMLFLVGWFSFRRHWTACRQIEHRPLGKAATATQFLFLITVIVAPDTDWLTWPLFTLAAIITALAALDYLVKLGPLCLQTPPEPQAA